MIDCVEIYKDDLNNEICSAITTGLKPQEYFLREIGIKNTYLIKGLSKMIVPINILASIASVFIVFLKLITAQCRYKASQNTKEIAANNLFLVFTPLFISRIKKTDIDCSPIQSLWIVGPNVENTLELPKDVESLSWEDLLCRKDYYKSFVEVFRICVLNCFETRILFPAYRLWELCIVAKGLEKISQTKDLFFSNQCDRWALLFDKLPSRSKTLLQHGIDLDYGGKLVKLKHIDKFYAISNGSWQNSYKYLLDCKPNLHIMNPTIELTDVDNSKFSILIVSHIIYFEIEKSIVEALKDLPVQVYVKKHPTVKDDAVYRELQSKTGFNYITDSMFPKVDFVIAYESTLAYEYMNYDIPVYMYGSEKECSINELKDVIMSTMNGKNAKEK